MTRRSRWLMLALPALLLAGCDRRPDSGHVVVSAIGAAPALRDPARDALTTPDRLLTDAVAQGLVRFDAAGQIEPGLAERWIVIDDGTSYIFRLRDAEWSNGKPVTAEDVVAILKRQVRAGSRNPLAPFLTAIDQIVVMTPQVIEIRLARPRPDLLKLFAQPEMALLRARPVAGSGPMRVVREVAAPLLRPAIDPARVEPDDPVDIRPEDEVRLIGERAARAIVRFAAHRSDLVQGGSFADWPLVAVAGIAPANIRIDPAVGLFGLAIVRREGFLADAFNRIAVSEALDRAGITAAIAPGWDPVDRILPDAIDSAGSPAVPAWTLLSLDERRAGARVRVAQWPGGAVRLRLALPSGPGATVLHAQIAASLATIGVAVDRVAIDDRNADLRLVDAVAPYDSGRWYLASACQPCGDAARTALEAARTAQTLTERGQRILEADAAINEDVPFIPIARPLRWSLVALRLRQWQTNSRAWHPLNRLRADTN